MEEQSAQITSEGGEAAYSAPVPAAAPSTVHVPPAAAAAAGATAAGATTSEKPPKRKDPTVRELKAWASKVSEKQTTRDPAKVAKAQEQAKLRVRARKHYKTASRLKTTSVMSSHAYAGAMRKAASARGARTPAAYESVSSDYQMQTTSLQAYMADDQADDEDDCIYNSRAGQAAQELAAELDVYATAPAMAAAVKSKRRAAPAYAEGAGGGGAGEEDDDDDDAYQVYDVAEGGAVSAGLAVAESENAVEQLAQTVAPVAEEEMLSLLEQLKEEPTNDEEMAAMFKLYEANHATVEAARGLLFGFWGECSPDFAEHALVKAAIESDMRKIDSPENMGINFEDTRVWFVHSMSRAVTKNNTVIDGVLKTIRTKLELLGSQDECPICFETLEGTPSVALGCAHAVCTECWAHWERAQAAQGRRAFCPLCKNEDFISSVLTYASAPAADDL